MEPLESNYDNVNWLTRASEFFRGFALFALIAQGLAIITKYGRNLKLGSLFGLPLLLIANVMKAIDAIGEFRRSPNKKFKLFGAMLYHCSVALALPLSLLLVTVLSTSALSLIAGAFLTAAIYFAAETAYEVFGLLTNSYKAFMAPKGSVERKSYSQQAINHFNKAIISGLITALFFVPMAQPVAIILAITAMTLSVGHAIWQANPNTRHQIKSFFGIEVMPGDKDEPTLIQNEQLLKLKENPDSIRDMKFEASHHTHLFKRAYRKSVVNRYLALDHQNDAKAYLLDEIETKLKQWPESSTGKRAQKRQALLHAKKVLANIEKPKSQSSYQSRHLLRYTQGVEQNFFSDVSDTKDLLEAVKTFLQKARFEAQSSKVEVSTHSPS